MLRSRLPGDGQNTIPGPRTRATRPCSRTAPEVAPAPTAAERRRHAAGETPCPAGCPLPRERDRSRSPAPAYVVDTASQRDGQDSMGRQWVLTAETQCVLQTPLGVSRRRRDRVPCQEQRLATCAAEVAPPRALPSGPRGRSPAAARAAGPRGCAAATARLHRASGSG